MHWWWMRDFSSAYGSTATGAAGVRVTPFGSVMTFAVESPCLESLSCRPMSAPLHARHAGHAQQLALLGAALRRRERLRERDDRLREVGRRVGDDGGGALVDRQRDDAVGGNLGADGDLQRRFHLALAEADLRVRAVQDV